MGMSLLHFTAMNKNPNNTEILRILLKKNIDVNSIAADKTSPLHYACATGLHFKSILVLNLNCLLTEKFFVSGNPDMVQLLLDSGANTHINLQDTIGDTPLMYAAYGSGAGNQQSTCLTINVDYTNKYWTGRNWNSKMFSIVFNRSSKSLRHFDEKRCRRWSS